MVLWKQADAAPLSICAIRYQSCSVKFYCQTFIDDVPADIKDDFRDSSEVMQRQLEELKQSIRSSKYPYLDNYPCNWKGVVDNKPMVDGLEAFGKHVLETFWKYMQEEVRFPFFYDFCSFR